MNGPYRRRETLARVLIGAVVDCACLLFGLAALGFAGLILFGSDADIAAWGRWFRNLIGG